MSDTRRLRTPRTVPTGTVTFFDGVTQLGAPIPLSGDTATYSTSGLSAGSHSITAQYNGDASYSASTSNPITQVVKTVSTVAITSAVPNPSTSGQAVTLTATVTPSAATGTVTFVDTSFLVTGDALTDPSDNVLVDNISNVLITAPKSTTLGTATLSGGSATLSLPSGFAASGTHSLQATYNGDANYAASSSALYTQTVSAAGDYHTGLIHRWRLTDADISAGQALDTVGSINFTINGSVTSATGPNASFPQGRAFSGVSGTFLGAGGTITSWTTTSAFSIAVWLWINNITANGPTSEPYMLMFDNTANGANYALLRNRTGANAGKLLVSAASASQTTNTAVFANNNWYHVVFTQTSGGVQTIYINGAAVASTGSSGDASWDGGTNLIGGGTGTDSLLTGRMAGVLVYNRALSSTDAAALYANNGAAP